MELCHLRDKSYFVSPGVVLVGFIISQFGISGPFTNSTYAGSVSPCNCVIFRLDGVQDYYTQIAQLAIMDLFLNKNQSLTLGLIANNIGNDSIIVDKILDGNKNGLFELAVHGWTFTDYLNLSEKEQKSALSKAIGKIGKLFGQIPNVFIPPYGSYNNQTVAAMDSLELKILSSFAESRK